MYRSLNIEALGISGRQSELIELALTYRFNGLDLDIEAFTRQVEKRGQDIAARFMESAKKCNGLRSGTWNLPVRWHASEETFKSDLKRLPAIARSALGIGATRCVTNVMAGSDDLPLKENFELHTQRLQELADLLAPHQISLGVGFHAAAKAREGFAHQFIDKADGLMTLVKAVGASNVGFLIDAWNWYLGEGTVDMVRGLPIEQIVAVRVADVPKDVDAASVEVKARLMPAEEGTVPVVELLNALSENDYKGPVAAYPHVSQFKGVTRDRLVQKCSDALRSVWPGAEILEEEAAEAAAAEEAAAKNGEAKVPVT
jgi:sugar phosphate isomerase/epimerase